MSEDTTNAAASGPRAELFVLSGPDVGRSFAVSHGSTLGRSPDRSIALRDKSISRHHAHFEFDQGRWAIVDDGSTNGFQVDGIRQQRALLTDLRDFVIGEVLVRLRTQAPEPAQSSTPTARVQAPPTGAPPAAIEDEIRLEEEIVLEDAPPAKPAHTFGQGLAALSAAAAPATPERPALARAAAAGIPTRTAEPSALGARGQRALQFHKQEARQGFLVSDLSQQPGWVRALVLLLALAIAAALAFGAYRLVLGLRQERATPAIETGENG